MEAFEEATTLVFRYLSDTVDHEWPTGLSDMSLISCVLTVLMGHSTTQSKNTC